MSTITKSGIIAGLIAAIIAGAKFAPDAVWISPQSSGVQYGENGCTISTVSDPHFFCGNH